MKREGHLNRPGAGVHTADEGRSGAVLTATPLRDDPNQDLGLGSRVAQKSRQRFLNRDGSFNVSRRGLSPLRSLSLYHWVLNVTWTRFFLLIALGYFAVNAFFATGYYLCGPGALLGSAGGSPAERFAEAFFFSVQTLATIGYGRMSPSGVPANLLVTFEALFGLMGFALATGLLFARVSRPSAQILFSESAVVAPYRDITAFMFRIVNERSNQLTQVEATVSLGLWEQVEGAPVRKFHELALERKRVVFMPLHWVIVHPINESSPLYGMSAQEFVAADAEVLILLTALDETFSQTVHARSSYKPQEVIWGAKFADMFHDSPDGRVSIDVAKLHLVEKVIEKA